VSDLAVNGRRIPAVKVNNAWHPPGRVAFSIAPRRADGCRERVERRAQPLGRVGLTDVMGEDAHSETVEDAVMEYTSEPSAT
jgi:hypothetical protein